MLYKDGVQRRRLPVPDRPARRMRPLAPAGFGYLPPTSFRSPGTICTVSCSGTRLPRIFRKGCNGRSGSRRTARPSRARGDDMT